MMFDHPHPGELLREEVVESGLTQAEFAAKLGMSRAALSRVLNGHTGISVDFARKLEETGFSTADFWRKLQYNYEISIGNKRLDSDELNSLNKDVWGRILSESLDDDSKFELVIMTIKTHLMQLSKDLGRLNMPNIALIKKKFSSIQHDDWLEEYLTLSFAAREKTSADDEKETELLKQAALTAIMARCGVMHRSKR